MTKMQKKNAELKERLSTFKEEILGGMMAKSMDFLKTDLKPRYMIDAVQHVIQCKMATDESTKGLDAFKLCHVLKELSQQLHFKEFAIEDIQKEMKHLRAYKINNFEELKVTLRNLFAKQKEFRDDWQVITADLDDIQDKLKLSEDQSIERFVSLFNILSVRQDLTIESVTETLKKDNINFDHQRSSNNCFVSCLLGIYQCIVVTFCCVFNYQSKKRRKYEYNKDRIQNAFDQLGFKEAEPVKTFDEIKKLSKQLFMPFGDKNSYLYLQIIDVCLTLASAYTSLACLYDFREDTIEANVDIAQKQNLLNIISISGALAIFQILISFERFGSTYKLNSEKNPSKDRIICYVVKQIVLGLLLELAQLALQSYLENQIGVILLGQMSRNTFIASVTTTGIEMMFEIFELAKPISDFNNQNPNNQIQCSKLKVTCSGEQCCKRLKLLAILIIACAVTFVASLVLHEKFNNIDPFSAKSFSLIGLSSTLAIEKCLEYSEAQSSAIMCTKCLDFFYVSDDGTQCLQESCNNIDQILEPSGKCGCKDKARASLEDGRCMCKQDKFSHINNYQPLDHDGNSAYGMCVCSSFFSRVDGQCDLLKPNKIECLRDFTCCNDVTPEHKGQCGLDQYEAVQVSQALAEAQVQPFSIIEWLYANQIKIDKIEQLRITQINYKATSFLEGFQLTLSDGAGNSYKLPVEGVLAAEELDQVQTFSYGEPIDTRNLFNKKNSAYDFKISHDQDEEIGPTSHLFRITSESGKDSEGNSFISRAYTHYFDPALLKDIKNVKESRAIDKKSESRQIILEFSAKDRDNNEAISLQELELLFEGLDKNYDVSKIMKVADINGDNTIDFREFVRMNLDG